MDKYLKIEFIGYQDLSRVILKIESTPSFVRDGSFYMEVVR